MSLTDKREKEILSVLLGIHQDNKTNLVNELESIGFTVKEAKELSEKFKLDRVRLQSKIDDLKAKLESAHIQKGDAMNIEDDTAALAQLKEANDFIAFAGTRIIKLESDLEGLNHETMFSVEGLAVSIEANKQFIEKLNIVKNKIKEIEVESATLSALNSLSFNSIDLDTVLKINRRDDMTLSQSIRDSIVEG